MKCDIGDTDIVHTQWKPPVPTLFAKNVISNSTLKELLEYDPISKREYKFIHPIREQSMFAPKTAVIEEKHKIFWLSFDELVIQVEIYTSKIPFSDAFIVKHSYHIKQIDATTVQLTYRGWIDFLKNFMFKGKVLKGLSRRNGGHKEAIHSTNTP